MKLKLTQTLNGFADRVEASVLRILPANILEDCGHLVVIVVRERDINTSDILDSTEVDVEDHYKDRREVPVRWTHLWKDFS